MTDLVPMYEGNISGTDELIKNVLLKALSEKPEEVGLFTRRIKKEREYAAVVEQIIGDIKIDTNASKEEIISSFRQRLEGYGVSSYNFSLIISLIAGRLEAVEAVLELRDQYHEKLSSLLEDTQTELDEAVDAEDHEESSMIREDLVTTKRELEIIKNGPLNRIVELLLGAEELDTIPSRNFTDSERNHALIEIKTAHGRKTLRPQLNLRLKLAVLYELPPAEFLRLENTVKSKGFIEDRCQLLKFLVECKKSGVILSTEDKAALQEFVTASFNGGRDMENEPEPAPEPAPEPTPSTRRVGPILRKRRTSET